MGDKPPNKIIAGLKEAVRHAQGEDTGARVRTYRVDNGAAVAKDDLIERLEARARGCDAVHGNGSIIAAELREAATALAARDARIAELSEALTALRDAVAKEPAMQGRQYVSLGIQVNNALNKAR